MQILGQIFSFVFGMAMVLGLLAFIYKRNAIDWEKLHKAYGRPWQPPLEQKSLQSMMLYREGLLARSFKGLLTIGIYQDGIGIRPFIWLLPFHPPIFVPFADVKGWQQKWYIDAKSLELSFSKVPSLRVIMPAEQVDWILSGRQGAFPVSSERPPHGSWPRWTFAIAIFFGVMSLVVLGISIYQYSRF